MPDVNSVMPNLDASQFHVPSADDFSNKSAVHKPKILLLYGSLRTRSFSRLVVEESVRLLEAMGGETVQGSLIVPADDRTYLLHCDMAQHMEMGMKGQLVVGEGSGNLWNVAGVSDNFERDNYLGELTWPLLGVLLLGLLLGLRGRVQ